jgi:hypothetical protein
MKRSSSGATARSRGAVAVASSGEPKGGKTLGNPTVVADGVAFNGLPKQRIYT